jgi:hypothetical protein
MQCRSCRGSHRRTRHSLAAVNQVLMVLRAGPRRGPRKQVAMRICAPRRAGDVAGPVLVVGADADMMPASDHVDNGARGVGDDFSYRHCPTRSRRVARDLRRECDRRCRSADVGPGTNVAERRRSCHVRARHRCAERSECHRLCASNRGRWVVGPKRAPQAMLASGGGALRAPARYEQNRTARKARQPQLDEDASAGLPPQLALR